jgi:hypothetical protein
LSSSSETLASRSSQSQQPISSLREPELCELFGYEPTFFGSQKFGSQKFGSQKVGSQKVGSQKVGSQKFGSRTLFVNMKKILHKNM